MSRIAVAGFHHETNTFAPSKATFADFEAPDAWPGLLRGEALFDAFQTLNVPMTGALGALRQAGHEIVPIAWASAGPSAHVAKDAYERIAGMIVDGLRQAGASAPLDGVYLDLHGAMVTEHLDDGEGELLARVRAVVADSVPVVASLDLHANVTGAMAARADALVAYRSYPHLDMAETGARAARHLSALLAEPAKPRARAFRKLDFLIPLTWQCSLVEPAKGLFAMLPRLESDGVSSISFTPGFPPVDIPECGPAVMAYGDDQGAVDVAADRLAAAIAGHEADFAGRLWTPEEAVAYAIAHTIPLATAGREAGGGPIILADTQDNPGAGADSNTTGILEELIRQDARDAALGILADGESAAAAHAAGTGARVSLVLGGKSGQPGDAPVEAVFEVEALSDGAFDATGPFYAGSRMQLGPMALLRKGGVRIVVSSRKQQAADQAMFAHLGLDPAAQSILVLKSSVHFRADFQALAAEVLVVEAPGPNIADTARLPFTRLRPGLRVSPLGPAFGD